VPLSATAERGLREIRTAQAAERLKAGSAWQQTGYVFTTELRGAVHQSGCRSSSRLHNRPLTDSGGNNRTRTCDPLFVRQVL
jgi:hypothetical protein